MATYVVLVNWTDQGARGFDKTTERVDHEEEIRKRAGVEQTPQGLALDL